MKLLLHEFLARYTDEKFTLTENDEEHPQSILTEYDLNEIG